MEIDKPTQENKEMEGEVMSECNKSANSEGEPMEGNENNLATKARRKKTTKKSRARKKSPKPAKASKEEKNDITPVIMDPKVIIKQTKRLLNGKRRYQH